MQYLIRHKNPNGKQYWSIAGLWVPRYGATRYSAEERNTVTLPAGGVWVKLRPRRT